MPETNSVFHNINVVDLLEVDSCMAILPLAITVKVGPPAILIGHGLIVSIDVKSSQNGQKCLLTPESIIIGLDPIVAGEG